MRQVLCVGSVSQDLFFPTDEGVILQTPKDLTAQVKVAFELGGKFRSKERYESIGGVAANVAIGLARLGIEAGCCSMIGADDLGRSIQTKLRGEGVETSSLQVNSAVRSDLSAIIVIEQTGDRIIFHNRDANEQLRVTQAMLRPTEWFYVSALNGAWEENMRTLLWVARDQHIKCALNPGQHNLKDNPRLMLEVLRSVDVLFLNKDEAIEILYSNHLETDSRHLNDEQYLLRALFGLGPTVVALTDGRRGAWATDGKTTWHASSFEPHGLVDTTGGGDAFGSGFFAAYLKRYSLDRCLAYGICNAGSVVGAYGATPGLLDEPALLSIINQVQCKPLV